MNAEHEQTDDDHEARDDEQSQNRSTMTRRQMLKVSGGAAAAAATGGASVSTAESTDDGSDSTGKHEAPNSIDGAEVDVEYALQTAAKTTEASMMVLTTPISAPLYAAGGVYGVTNMAHWLAGKWGTDPDKAQNEQLRLDVNAHCRTLRDNMQSLMKQSFNNFEMLNNNALIAGEVAAVKAIKDGESEANVAADAQARVEDMVAVHEENVYRIWESVIVRAANLRAQEVTGYADSDYDPSIVYHRNVNGDPDRVIGTRSFDIELVNGETITTEALVAAKTDGSGDILYVHPIFAKSGKVPNYDQLSSDADGMMAQLSANGDTYDKWENHGLTCKKYDENNDLVRLFSTDGWIQDLLPDFGAESDGQWSDYIQLHVIDRASTLTSDMQQYVSDLFSALSSGEIENVEEVMSPQAYAELLAGDWLETGSTGFPIGAARMGGYSTDIKRKGTYVHVDGDGENQSYSGANLLWDSRNPPDLGSLSAETLGGSSWTINAPIGSGSTLHLDGLPESGVEFSASHSSESMDSIGVKLGTGDSATPVAATSASNISPKRVEWEDALSQHGVSHGDTVTIAVEASTGGGSSTTVTATEIKVLVETRLRVGSEYTVPSKATVYIADKNGMHTIPSGDAVRIESAKDANGNALDYLTVGDETLVTLDDTDDVQEQWNNILESQQDVEEETPDGDDTIGDDGPGGGGINFGDGIGLTHVLGGVGVLTVLSGLASLVDGDNNRR
ncbi:hypothetical protein J2754_001563 [Halarchaeum solikamskense]|uniref:twin-arginine translocation signal domain-containing protein n=1 Tax=Halarchaeum nitratireducens TaxID=489913 RepID=UPI001B3AB7EB|nr:twin-arginine translocation signal domain-containing protein [Halarchaeum solikamskense]MBP2251242.1 hypothetical protein [Halarchaeum solikamskense]